jgi:hypothetical protein
MQQALFRGFRAAVDERPFMYAFLASISGVQMLAPLAVSFGAATVSFFPLHMHSKQVSLCLYRAPLIPAHFLLLLFGRCRGIRLSPFLHLLHHSLANLFW